MPLKSNFTSTPNGVWMVNKKGRDTMALPFCS
jgi:hypothetical protein